MRHDDAYSRLAELVTTPPGERDGAVDAAVLAHVARCPECATRLATLTRIDRALLGARRDRRALPEPPASLDRNLAAIPFFRHTAARPRVLRPRAIAAAATLMLALAIAGPLWLSSSDSHNATDASRTMTLDARNGALSGSVVLGRRVGKTRSLRIMADGLRTGNRGDYSVWLMGPDGNILIRSFSANPRGACDIRADLPERRWSGIAITVNGQAPVANTIVAQSNLT